MKNGATCANALATTSMGSPSFCRSLSSSLLRPASSFMLEKTAKRSLELSVGASGSRKSRSAESRSCANCNSVVYSSAQVCRASRPYLVFQNSPVHPDSNAGISRLPRGARGSASDNSSRSLRFFFVRRLACLWKLAIRSATDVPVTLLESARGETSVLIRLRVDLSQRRQRRILRS